MNLALVTIGQLRAAAERRRRFKAGGEKSQDIYRPAIEAYRGRVGDPDSAQWVKWAMQEDERLLADYAEMLLLSPPADPLHGEQAREGGEG